MLELGISQAQTQFTQLLNQTVLIIDKKSHNKKAVIVPYEKYMELLTNIPTQNKTEDAGVFSKFVGVLDNTFETNDIKYNEIIK